MSSDYLNINYSEFLPLLFFCPFVVLSLITKFPLLRQVKHFIFYCGLVCKINHIKHRRPKFKLKDVQIHSGYTFKMADICHWFLSTVAKEPKAY